MAFIRKKCKRKRGGRSRRNLVRGTNLAESRLSVAGLNEEPVMEIRTKRQTCRGNQEH